MTEADIARVIRVFETCQAKWALVGAYAVGLLTEPRATVDFDFIVEARKLKSVVSALGAIDVDLIRSNNHALFREALDRAQLVGEWRIPPPEVIIALKFLSAVSPWRNRDKRSQDIVDLRTVYHSVGPETLDADTMSELAALVYPGAEREFEKLLARIDRGDPVEI